MTTLKSTDWGHFRSHILAQLLAALLATLILVLTLELADYALAEDSTASTAVVGEVEAATHDDEGNATAVAIFDEYWGAVLVRNEGPGRELTNLVGAFVRAIGRVEELETADGYNYEIAVESYTILDEDEEDLDTEYDSWNLAPEENSLP